MHPVVKVNVAFLFGGQLRTATIGRCFIDEGARVGEVDPALQGIDLHALRGHHRAIADDLEGLNPEELNCVGPTMVPKGKQGASRLVRAVEDLEAD